MKEWRKENAELLKQQREEEKKRRQANSMNSTRINTDVTSQRSSNQEDQLPREEEESKHSVDVISSKKS